MMSGVVKRRVQLNILDGGGGLWRSLKLLHHGPVLEAPAPCQNGAFPDAKLHDQPAREGTVYIHVSKMKLIANNITTALTS